jgi:hydroxymethylpyrimidine/phosphomethylpyrimidine kinase / thiaminase
MSKIESVLSDIKIDAFKTGMLLDSDTVTTVASALDKHFNSKGFCPFVCDPVCVSTSGHTLLHPEAIHAMIAKVFPICTIITPNKSEAVFLLKTCDLGPSDIETLDDMVDAAKNLILLGSQAVLLKGGHFVTTASEVEEYLREHPETKVIQDGLLGPNMEILMSTGAYASSNPQLVLDVLCEREKITTFFLRPRLDTTSTHGTGCTLSSSIACHLGRGKTS